MYAKLMFDGFLEAFRFGELYLLDLFTVWNRTGFFMGTMQRCVVCVAQRKNNFQVEFA